MCSGEGSMKSYFSIMSEIEKEIIRIKNHTNINIIKLKIKSRIYKLINDIGIKDIQKMQEHYCCNIELINNDIEDCKDIQVVFK